MRDAVSKCAYDLENRSESGQKFVALAQELGAVIRYPDLLLRILPNQDQGFVEDE